jgi:hypothetical protein
MNHRLGILGLFLASIYSCLTAYSQTIPNHLTWQLLPLSSVHVDASTVSKPGLSTSDWVAATVPGTAFYAYVAAGKEKNPDYGDNIYQVDQSKYNQPFWYRTEFTTPRMQAHQHLWLKLNGINKTAEVFVNGKHLGTIKGHIQRGIYDITSIVTHHQKNAIAVLVTPPRNDPYHQHGLANWESPTYICSGSWDWMPAVPGLNSGITDSVILSVTGAVDIADPWIRVNLPKNNLALINASAMVSNNSNKAIQGRCRAVIQPGNIDITSPLMTLAAGRHQEVNFLAKDFAELKIRDPKLWWPNGYGGKSDGTQHLYTCKFYFETGIQQSDVVTKTFGVRRISYDTTTAKGAIKIYVNGVPILIKGGNWGMSDYMLKVRGKDYDTRIRMHQAMNFNMIRNWTGEVTDEAFYNYCDKYGMMIWDDFWLNNMGSIDSLDIFKANVVEKVKKFRNHPSVVIWCGANEGVPGGNPHGPISNAITDVLKQFDGSYRIYLPRSNAGVNNPNFSIHGGSKNLSGSGIWANVDPKTYFTDPHNGYLFSQNSWGMRSELGMATFVNPESFKKFMPEAYWVPPTPEMVNSKDNMWAKHFFSTDGAIGGGADPVRYINDINRNYGKATSLEDFCKKAQMLNLETMKAMFEAWNDHMWNDATGMLIWMSQSAYPSMIWQTYDYYFDLTGAYFGAKNACEPVHIQWNPATNTVKVVNNRPYPLSHLTAEAKVYNMDGKIVAAYTQKANVTAPATSFTEVFKIFQHIKSSDKLSPVYFIKLKLCDKAGHLVSENTYWAGKTYLDYTALKNLPSIGNKLSIKPLKAKSAHTTGLQHLSFVATNNSTKSAAFGVRVQLLDNRGVQILPALINESYFTLMQGEKKCINVEVDTALLKNGCYLKAEPFNK